MCIILLTFTWEHFKNTFLVYVSHNYEFKFKIFAWQSCTQPVMILRQKKIWTISLQRSISQIDIKNVTTEHLTAFQSLTRRRKTTLVTVHDRSSTSRTRRFPTSNDVHISLGNTSVSTLFSRRPWRGPFQPITQLPSATNSYFLIRYNQKLRCVTSKTGRNTIQGFWRGYWLLDFHFVFEIYTYNNFVISLVKLKVVRWYLI